MKGPNQYPYRESQAFWVTSVGLVRTLNE